METYPSFLPAPLRDSYSLTSNPNIRRSQFDSGRVRQRKLDNSSKITISPIIRYSLDQYRVFAAWVHFKINDGADQFYIDLHGLNGLKTHVVQMVNGEYGVKHNDGHWDVTPTLEVFNPETMTEAELDAEL